MGPPNVFIILTNNPPINSSGSAGIYMYMKFNVEPVSHVDHSSRSALEHRYHQNGNRPSRSTFLSVKFHSYGDSSVI